MPNYAIDPATGMPLLQTPGGGALPLPLSPADMAAAGAQPMPAPPNWAAQMGPLPPELQGPGPGALADNAPVQVSPGSRTVRRDAPTGGISTPGAIGRANRTPEQIAALNAGRDAEAAAQRAKDLEAERQALAAKAANPQFQNSSRAMASLKLAQQKNAAEIEANKPKPAAGSGGAVNPADLVKPGAGGGSAQASSGGQGQGGVDPLVQQVFEESLRGGGGGGPAHLGVTSRTQKYFQPGAVPEEDLDAAEKATQAREGFDLLLADRAGERSQNLDSARAAEANYRLAQAEAERQRQAEQQRQLDDYGVKRDTAMAEAASMKSPDMADYWGTKSDFAKMMTAVSIAIGGALQGLRGGSNPGLEMSNQSIDRWLLTQREDYQRAQDKGQALDNQFGRMMQRFGSENLATANLREQAYTVRDAMLQDYANDMNTTPAQDAAQRLLLVDQEERAKAKVQAQAQAGAEIEEKLSMQGGGGGRPTLLAALKKAAEAKGAINTINGTDKPESTREAQGETTDAVTSSLDAIDAANRVQGNLHKQGYEERDSDDPTSGPIDYVASAVPGSDTRRANQDLEQDTFQLARAAQQSLGKSDNDANLADKMAKGGGGSGRERYRAAEQIKRKAIAKLQDKLSGMSPPQRRAFIDSLPPERRQQLQGALGSIASPQAAPSEQAVP